MVTQIALESEVETWVKSGDEMYSQVKTNLLQVYRPYLQAVLDNLEGRFPNTHVMACFDPQQGEVESLASLQVFVSLGIVMHCLSLGMASTNEGLIYWGHDTQNDPLDMFTYQYCDLVLSHGNIKLSQHWLRQCLATLRNQVIAWAKVLVTLLRAISEDIPQSWVIQIKLKITCLSEIAIKFPISYSFIQDPHCPLWVGWDVAGVGHPQESSRARWTTSKHWNN